MLNYKGTVKIQKNLFRIVIYTFKQSNLKY